MLHSRSSIPQYRTPLFLSALVFSIFCALPAQAELTRDQAQCVNKLNQQLVKVDKEVSKQISQCIQNQAKGRPLNRRNAAIDTMEECIQDDPYGKIQRAKTQTEQVFNKYCMPSPTGYLEDPFPYFGATDADTVNMAGMEKTQNLVHDIFGSNLDSGVLETKRNNWKGAICQQLVWGVVSHCEQSELKQFQQCKKNGLKGRTPPGLIQDGDDLQNLCLPLNEQTQTTRWKSYGSQCTNLLRPTLQWLCRGQDLPTRFPGCTGGTASSTAECLEDKVECRVCIAANKADGLSQDCDLFDDGQANNSCGAPVSTCGDGTEDPNETCDDGNTDADDGCSATCEIEECGDGIIQTNEVCDDEGTDAGDGCSDTCQVEEGFECTGQPSTCGDINECSSPNTNNCDDNATCTDTPGSFTCECLPGFDGDGVVCVDTNECSETPEICDPNATCTNAEGSFTCACGPGYQGDGQTCTDIDECTAGTHTCTPDEVCSNTDGAFACVLGVCGDGVTQAGLGETCDDGGTDSEDGCSATCQIESCGDGTIQAGLGEVCDDGNMDDGDGCDGTCQIEQPPTAGVCGDGTQDPGEECDDGNTADGDDCSVTCQINLCGETNQECNDGNSINYDACTNACKLPVCGDGIISSPPFPQITEETCDDGNTVNGDGCNATCVVEFCGNGYVDDGEVCDPGLNLTPTFFDPVQGGFVYENGNPTTMTIGQDTFRLDPNGTPNGNIMHTCNESCSISEGEQCNGIRCGENPVFHGICLCNDLVCTDGYNGPNCEFPPSLCPTNCSGNGDCVAGTCQCNPGFVGAGCDCQIYEVCSPNETFIGICGLSCFCQLPFELNANGACGCPSGTEQSGQTCVPVP